MNVVERVARAMDACLDGPVEWGTMHPKVKAIMMKQARAAIEALRDNVTDGMIEAGDKAAREKVTVEHYPSGPCLEMEPDLAVYTLDAMLTAALNEEKEET